MTVGDAETCAAVERHAEGFHYEISGQNGTQGWRGWAQHTEGFYDGVYRERCGWQKSSRTSRTRCTLRNAMNGLRTTTGTTWVDMNIGNRISTRAWSGSPLLTTCLLHTHVRPGQHSLPLNPEQTQNEHHHIICLFSGQRAHAAMSTTLASLVVDTDLVAAALEHHALPKSAGAPLTCSPPARASMAGSPVLPRRFFSDPPP